MHRNLSILAVGVLAASLSACQLIEALLPGGASQVTVAGTCATYQVVATDEQAVTPELLELTRTIIGDRVGATGVADPTVVTQGTDRIWVELPGVEDGADIRSISSLITTPGVLVFMPVPPELQGTVTEGPLPAGMADIEPLFTGVEIASAAITRDDPTGEPAFDLQLKDTGARLFDEYVADHYGEQFAIVLDGEVMSAPVIRAARFLGGRVQISGGQDNPLTEAEAHALVTTMRSGSLPLEVRELDLSACEVVVPSPTPGVATHPGPVVLGGRIEVPSAGFALSVPTGWHAFDLSDPGLTAAMATFDETTATLAPHMASLSLENMAPDLTAAYPLVEVPLVAFAPLDGPTAGENCIVMVGPSDTDSLDHLVAGVMRGARSMTNLARDPEPVFIELPAGRTSVIEYTDAPRDAAGEQTHFILLHDGQMYMLACGDATRHAHRWRSIAESIEFLLPRSRSRLPSMAMDSALVDKVDLTGHTSGTLGGPTRRCGCAAPSGHGRTGECWIAGHRPSRHGTSGSCEGLPYVRLLSTAHGHVAMKKPTRTSRRVAGVRVRSTQVARPQPVRRLRRVHGSPSADTALTDAAAPSSR